MSKKNKKIIVFSSILIILILILILILNISAKKENYEELLKGYMKDMGREYYEKLHYPNLGNGNEELRKNLLKQYENIGFKITLDNLIRYKTLTNEDKINTFINPVSKEECDKNASILTIYPKEPFRVNDYELKVELICGFQD